MSKAKTVVSFTFSHRVLMVLLVIHKYIFRDSAAREEFDQGPEGLTPWDTSWLKFDLSHTLPTERPWYCPARPDFDNLSIGESIYTVFWHYGSRIRVSFHRVTLDRWEVVYASDDKPEYSGWPAKWDGDCGWLLGEFLDHADEARLEKLDPKFGSFVREQYADEWAVRLRRLGAKVRYHV